MVEISANQSPRGAKKISGRSFLIGLSLFFLSVFAANGIMAYYALSTFDGLEIENAYRKGRTYNHVLDAAAAQAARGWKITIENVPAYTPNAIVLNIKVTLKDRDDKAISLPTVPLAFWRPTAEGMDVDTSLTAMGDGTYVGQIILAEAGNWVARINTLTPQGDAFVYEERLFIPPAPGQ